MADKVLSVKLNATDGVSGPLKKIATSATQTGDALESAGKEAKAGFDDVEQGAEDASRSMDDLKSNAMAVGAAIGTVGTAVMVLGRNNRDATLQIDAINRAYGDQADALLDLTERIQDYSRFSNDSAREAALTFQTLADNYALSIGQLDALMMRSADVAQLRGRSLEEVSQMLQNAIRGEGEYAEAIGVTANDTFLATEYARQGLGEWTKVTDEAVKAQFRLQVIMDQTGYAAGAAGDQVQGAGGRFRQFLNEVDDAGEAVGGFLGPIGEVAAEMAPVATALPVVTAGLGRMAATVRTSSLALTAVSIATNPVVLGLGALAVAGIATWNMFNEGRESAQQLEDALIQLGDVSMNLRLGYRDEEAGFLDDFSEGITRLQEDLDNLDIDQVVSQMAAMRGEHPRYIFDEIAQGMDMSTEESGRLTTAIDAIGKAFANTGIDAVALDTELGKLFGAYERREITFDEFLVGLEGIVSNLHLFRAEADAAAASAAVFNDQVGRLRELANGASGGVDELTSSVNRVESAIQDGTLSVDALEAYMADLDYRMATGVMTYAQYREAIENVDEALLGIIDATDLGASVLDTATTAYEEATVAAEEHAAAQEEARAAIAETGAAAGQFALDMQAANDAAREMTAELGSMAGEFATEEIEAYNDALQETLTTVLELSGNADITSQLNMTGAASQASILAERITDVGTALDNTFRAIVGNTNAIGNQMQGMADWATDLIGDPGYWAEIDDLLAEGRISLEKYNQAQLAQITITDANATVQRDLLAIQAAQAPVLAANSQNMADYVQRVRMMNDGINDTVTGAQDQLAVLALMDQGYQNQLLHVMEMADAFDDLGPSGEAAFGSMIDSMVALDPAMAAVLEKVGYIDNVVRDQDGRILSYDVQIDGADGAISEIEKLTNSVDALTLALGGTPPSYDVEVTGIEDVEAAEQSIYDLIALANQEALIHLRTVLEPPPQGLGDGTGGPLDLTGIDPVQIPTVYAPPERSWADDGYMGGWVSEPVEVPTIALPPILPDDIGPLLIPTEVEEPEIPVDFWTPAPIQIPVELDFSGLGSGVSGAASDALTAAQNAVSITVTQSGAEETSAALDTVTSSAAAIPEAEILTVILMGAGEAVMGLDAVTTAAAGIPEAELVSVFVMGAGEAVTSLNAVALAAAAIPESVSTTITTNRVTNVLTNYSTTGAAPGQPGFILPGGRSGGIVGNLRSMAAFAGGGMVPFIGGEAGPELAYFAGGGLASLPVHGVYSAPANTYISPAHTTASSQAGAGGPRPVNLYNYGTIVGVDDLTEQIAAAIWAAEAAEEQRYSRAHGGMS
jgi:hypothetical protein